jgi:hypothetical protein
VLTCPAIGGPYRREYFDEATKQAGLTDAVIVTEPEAAATHYAAERRLNAGELVAVYDHQAVNTLGSLTTQPGRTVHAPIMLITRF